MSSRSITLTWHPDGDTGRVYIDLPDGEPSFEEWMTCTEFLMHLTATKSGAGFERALELLSDGAVAYKKLPGESGALGGDREP